jgi:Ca2+/Na+ antiporter
MPDNDKTTSLGKLIAVHPIAPALVQRAVFIAALSFMFFLTMMFTFYLRQNILYFLLASAFLVLYLVMMFALLMQRRSTVEVFENGFRTKKQSIRWNDVASISDEGSVELASSKKVLLSGSVVEFDGLVATLRKHSNY